MADSLPYAKGLNKTLYDAFQSACRHFPSRTALIDYVTGEKWSYADLLSRVNTVAKRIQSDCPVSRGEQIGILMANQMEWVVAFFALQAAGCVVVPLSTRLSAEELKMIVRDADMKGLFFGPEFQDSVTGLSEDLAFWVQVQAQSVSDVSLPVFSMQSWMTEADKKAEWNPQDASLEALSVLIYTSGTTGQPKGVMLSHRNLLADAFANIMVIEAVSEDVFVTTSPLFHVFGLTNVMLTALLCGASIVLVRRFNPKAVLEAISKYQVTFLAAVPTMYQMMLTVLSDERYDLSTLRVCHSGAAPMHQAVFHQVESQFGAPVQEGYGQSEASSIVTSNPLHGIRKPGSIGKPIPSVTLEIVDDDHRPVLPGQVGQLRIHGETVMLGYRNNPDATTKVLRDGWLYTSDMGYRDEDGYIFLHGRQDDLMNVGGAKVYPQEVEEILYKHPDVLSCAVKAEPCSLYHHTVSAYIVVRSGAALTANQLQQFCKDSIAEYKVPKAIYFVQEIPKGPSGKILRHQLTPALGKKRFST